MSLDQEILKEINERLSRIEKKLNIVPDRETTITDFEDSLEQLKTFSKDSLKLEPVTIANYSSTIEKFLVNSNGIINQETVQHSLIPMIPSH